MSISEKQSKGKKCRQGERGKMFGRGQTREQDAKKDTEDGARKKNRKPEEDAFG